MAKILEFKDMLSVYTSKKRCLGKYCDLYYDDIKFKGCRYNEVYHEKATSEHIIEQVSVKESCLHFDYLKIRKKHLAKNFGRNLMCKIIPCSKKSLKKAVNG